MDIDIIKIGMPDLTKQVTCKLELTGMKEFKIRLAICALLMRLAIWITGMNVKVSVDKVE